MRTQINIFLVLAICLVASQPVLSLSRWFTFSFYDLQTTLKRYTNCLGDLPAFKDSKFNETDYLVNQVKVFLNQGNYGDEQLANVSLFMDTICKQNVESYAVSGNIHVDSYKNASGKAMRCRAIDDALNSIYHVFKRAATNKSEPLDFSLPKLYSSSKHENRYYNLSDLINTSWITSEAPVDLICNITDPIKEYVAVRINENKNSKAQDRSDDPNRQSTSYLSSLMAYIDRMLDRILGQQRRFYWEGNYIVGQTYSSVGSNLASLGSGLSNRFQSMRTRVTGLFLGSSNSTSSSSLTSRANATALSPSVSQNLTMSSPTSSTTSKPATNKVVE